MSQAPHPYANGTRRRKDRARMAALGRPCAICGAPIDYGLPAGDPWSYELDEVKPRSRGGSVSFDNSQPAHRVCNALKGDRQGFYLCAPPTRTASGKWSFVRAVFAGGPPAGTQPVAWSQGAKQW